MLKTGIDPSELVGTAARRNPRVHKAKRAPPSCKYKYTGEGGQEKTWTGQGCIPKAIAEAVAAGKALMTLIYAESPCLLGAGFNSICSRSTVWGGHCSTKKHRFVK